MDHDFFHPECLSLLIQRVNDNFVETPLDVVSHMSGLVRKLIVSTSSNNSLHLFQISPLLIKLLQLKVKGHNLLVDFSA